MRRHASRGAARRRKLRDGLRALGLALAVHVGAAGLLWLGTLTWQPERIEIAPSFTLVDAAPVVEARREERLAEEQAEAAQRRLEQARREEAERQQRLERERREAEQRRLDELRELRRQREEAQRQREEQERRLAELAERRAAEEERIRAEQEAERLRLARERAEANQRRATLREEYVATIQELVRRNWLRPPTADPGVRCAVRVVQIPGGVITDQAIASPCNADPLTRESILSAVQRTEQLPYEGYEEVFEREIVFIFRYDGN